MQQKGKKLSMRVVAYCTALASALCLVLGSVGYYIYYIKTMESYEMYVDSILNIVDSMVDADDMAQCIRTLETSEKYEQTQMLMNDIKTNTMVQFIYIIAPMDEQNIHDVIYVCNAFTEEERINTPEDLVEIGEKVQSDAFPEFMLEVFNETMFENPQVSYISNDAGFGNMLTGTKPVLDSQGNTVCLICVDFSMEEIYSTMYDYILGIVISTIITALLALFIIVSRIKKTIVKPIQEMAAATGDFVQQSHTVQDPSLLAYRRVEVKQQDEIAFLSDSIAGMMSDVVDYMKNLTHVTAEKERISAELNVATQIQQSMIPKIYPAFPERSEFEIYGNILSAKQMGGTFFDYFFIDNEHFGFFIGDIHHTGISAALMMVITRTMIKNYSQLGYDVGKVCQETNNQLRNNNETASMKITVFMGIVDLSTGEMTYVNAGHRVPYIKRSGEKFQRLPARENFPLGSMENVPYWKQSIRLMQGDLLFMYTGGLPDAQDRKGENFSEQRMVEQMDRLVDTRYGIKDLVKGMEQSVQQFTEGIEQEKDIALMLFRYFWG